MADKNAPGSGRKTRYQSYRNIGKLARNRAKGRNKYIKWLEHKLLQLQTRSKPTTGVERELAYAKGDVERPNFATGAMARAIGIRKASLQWNPDKQ